MIWIRRSLWKTDSAEARSCPGLAAGAAGAGAAGRVHALADPADDMDKPAYHGSARAPLSFRSCGESAEPVGRSGVLASIAQQSGVRWLHHSGDAGVVTVDGVGGGSALPQPRSAAVGLLHSDHPADDRS